MDNPCILLREPEIVENVLVKNFTSFHDNILDVKKENDPIFGNNPFTAKGEYWKNKRTQHLSGLTPSKVNFSLLLILQQKVILIAIVTNYLIII